MNTVAKEQFSILDNGVVIEGTMSCQGKLVINGTVKGKLTGDTIIIGEKGAANAEIEAAKITIGGKFEGKINASQELVILSTGNCEGEVVCKNIVIESGGILNGSVVCTLKREQPTSPKVPAKSGKS